MAKLLYLVHRLPYPPNKGDKVRSYHLLKHLARNHEVFLGTFVDDPSDYQYVATVKNFCNEIYVANLNPLGAKVKSLFGLLTGEALTMRYYQDNGLTKWVEQVVRQNKIDAAIVFSSAMGQYIGSQSEIPVLVDFVDVDSAKWTQYVKNHRWPMSWLYLREGARLLAYERSLAKRAKRSFFVTENEAALFQGLAPESAAKIESISNGVDADFFSPDPLRGSPFSDAVDHAQKIPLVFTGAMDYLPNIDAVTWFASEILPKIQVTWPQVCFYVVGRSPSSAVLNLANDSVVITGTVSDVRPYLQYAAVVVAPLRIARGIQNKILEAMAMGRPVVASKSCVEAIDATVDRDLFCAETADDFYKQIDRALRDAASAEVVGSAGRQRVLLNYSWSAHLSKLDTYLPVRATP